MVKIEGIPRMQFSSPNASVVMGCELSVSLRAAQLNECLRKLCKSHPLISKIATIDEQNNALLIAPEEVHFNIVEYEGQPYEAITERQLKEEWKLGEPLIKFIINHRKNGCQLIISCNHAICDGLSLVYLLEDIACYFQEGYVSKEEVIVQLHPSNMQKKQATWLFKLIAFVMSSKWKKHAIRLSEQMLSNIYKAYWEKHDAKLLSITFDREETQKIIEAAKKKEVTVNTYLTYLLYKSQFSHPPKPFQDEVIISVNLRDKLKTNPKRQLGYFVAAIRLNLSKFSTDKSTRSLKLLQTKIKSKLSSKSLFRSLALYFFDPRFFDLIQLNRLQLRQDKSMQKIVSKHGSRVKTALAITNLGVLKPNIKCENTLTEFLPLAIVSDTIEKYVSVFTYDGKMKVGICYDPTIISNQEMAKFRALLIEKLKVV